MSYIVFVFAIFCLCVIVYYAFWNGKEKDTPSPKVLKRRFTADDILVKRHYTLRHSVPQATTVAKTEQAEVKENTFAVVSENHKPMQVPDEKLDEVFATNLEMEVQEELLEFETENQINLEDLEDELLELSFQNDGFASGVLYEDIEEAVSVAIKETPTLTEKQKAGEVFMRIEGDDLYDKLMRNAPQLSKNIKEIMNYALLNTDINQNSMLHEVSDDLNNFDIQSIL